jgi:hypothetical protein
MKKYMSWMLILSIIFTMIPLNTVKAETTGNWQDDGVPATSFVGGSGTEESPYEIANASQLAYLAKKVNEGDTSYNAAYYKLTDNIDLGTHFWTPIGNFNESNEEKVFKGKFDGNGKVISNVKIGTESNPDNTYDYVGLFGRIYTNASIKNVGVSVKIFSSKEHALVGGLVGDNWQATISNSYVTGNVKGGNSDAYIGGVTGRNTESTISDSYFRGNVIGGDTAIIGGLIGTSLDTMISNSYAICDVTGGDSWIGGLAGEFSSNDSDGNNEGDYYIENCYATGDMTGGVDAILGGFIGLCSGKDIVKNCYYDSSSKQIVNGSERSLDDKKALGESDDGSDDGASKMTSENMKAGAGTDGALVDLLNDNKGDHSAWKQENGVNDDYPTFGVSTAVHKLNVSITAGGVTGSVKATITGSATSKFVVNITDASVVTPNEGDVAPTTGDNLIDSYISEANITNGVEADKYIQIYDVDVNGEVVKFYQKKITAEIIKQDEVISDDGFAGGSGTEESPYEIATVSQLEYLAEKVNEGDTNYNAAYYKLTDNIDLGERLWTPIGNEEKVFKGKFDGNGKVISNVNIGTESNPDDTYEMLGLFGHIKGTNEDHAIIKNVGVSVKLFTSKERAVVGGIVGQGWHATIDNSYVTGDINGGSLAGGLAGGCVLSDISNSYFKGNVTIKTDDGSIGGLVGDSGDTTISNSYAIGNVTSSDGSPNTGGLVGALLGKPIENSYFSGNMKGVGGENSRVGGIVGYTLTSDNVKNCYYNIDSKQIVDDVELSIDDKKAVGTFPDETADKVTSEITSEKMKAIAGTNGALVDLLNQNKGDHLSWKQAIGVNDDYPTFAVSKPVAVLTVNVTSGTAIGSTKVNISEGATSKFVVNITDASVSIPNEGDSVPTTGDHLIDGYINEADIKKGVVKDKYLQIYDVDAEGKVVKFYQKQLTAETINTTNWQDDGAVATSFAGGAGTENSPYEIANASQLAYLAKKVNEGDTDYNGAHYKLTNNIDVGESFWTPIGDMGNPFKGKFDGDGKKISNIYIGTESNPNDTHGLAGLFGYIINGSIKNVGVSVRIFLDKEGATMVGGLSGAAENTTISNSYVTGVVINRDEGHVGGFVGSGFETSISNSYVSCDVTGNKGMIGGFLGFYMSSNADLYNIQNSYTTGHVTGGENAVVGAFIGNSIKSDSIKKCYYNSDSKQEVNGVERLLEDKKGIGQSDGDPIIKTTSEKMKASKGTEGALVDILNTNKGSDYPTWYTWNQDSGKNDAYPTMAASVPASTLNVSIATGSVSGSTKATISDSATSKFVVNITDASVATPNVGDIAPTTGDNLIDNYVSEADITNGVEADKYLQIYDVDENGEVVKFYEKKLANTDINKDIENAKTALDETDFTYGAGDDKDNVTKNFTLPLNGENETNITWEEKTDIGNNVSIDNGTGVVTVTRPANGNGDAHVTLTATISKGSERDTKELSIIVKEEPKVIETTVGDKTPISISFDMLANNYKKRVFLVLPQGIEVDSDQNISIINKDNNTIHVEDYTITDNSINGKACKQIYQIINSDNSVTDYTVTLPIKVTNTFDTSTLVNDIVSLEYIIVESASSNVRVGEEIGEIKLKVNVANNDVPNAKEALDETDFTYGAGDDKDNVTKNFTLPLSGENETTITWEEKTDTGNNVSIDHETGVVTVTRPDNGNGDAHVTLTATISKGSESDTKELSITVKETPLTDAGAVALDKGALNITYGGSDAINNVTEDMTLPTSGSNGTTISWSSGDTSAVTNDGTVIRPTYGNGDVNVKLTATISKGQASDTKEFNVTVKEGQNYAIEKIDNQTMSEKIVGYTSGSQETKSITITKTGAGNLVNLSVALSGTNSNDFEITQPGVTTLDESTTSTSFTIKAKDGLAEGTYIATLTLSANNMTDVTFTVTQVVAAKPLSTDCDVSSITKPSGATKNGSNITAKVDNVATEITLDMSVSNNATWKLYSDVNCTNEITNKTMNLNVGDNTAYVKVIAENGTTTKIYNITITRGVAPDSSAPYIKGTNPTNNAVDVDIAKTIVVIFSEDILAGSNLDRITLKNGNTVVDYVYGIDDDKLTINPKLDLDNGTLYTLTIPEQTVTDTVYNSLEDQYILNFTTKKILSNNADLAGINLGNITLIPAFNPNQKEYTASVGYSIGSITITPTKAEDNTKISVNGKEVTSGQASEAINLNVGSNTITIVVTAEDETTKIYTIKVTREEKKDDGGSSSGDNNDGGSSSSGGSPSSTTPSESESKQGSKVIVNGEEETAGKETIKEENGQKNVELVVDSEILNKKIEEVDVKEEANNVVEVAVEAKQADKVETVLTGDIVKKMDEKEFKLSIKTDEIDYIIPAKEVGIDQVSEILGVKKDSLKEIKVEVQIEKLDAKIVKEIEEKAKAQDYEVVFPPVEFKVVAKTTNNAGEVKSTEISKFKNYVERVMEIPEGVDPSKITTGIVYNADGTFSHIPTEVFKKGDKWYAKLNSLTNSSYSVIWNPITVESVENHWSKEYVNDLASRLVIKNPENFKPDECITRGEFAEYITKAIGVYRTKVAEKGQFTDVEVKDELADAITTAVEYGIIKGYPDGTFRSDGKITREEAMTMYAKAMDIVKLSEKDNSRIENYKDKNQVSPWAYDFVKKTISANVFNGRTKETIAPQGTFTYAEASAAIQNLLIEAKLINKRKK